MSARHRRKKNEGHDILVRPILDDPFGGAGFMPPDEFLDMRLEIRQVNGEGEPLSRGRMSIRDALEKFG